MKLALKDIAKRIVIKLDKTIKSTGVNGYMKFGDNNDYPQTIERLINSSITAKSTANIYAKFLSGQGFVNNAINDIVIGHDSKGKKITVRSLLRAVSESMANNNGSYLHVNLTLEGKIVNVRPVPFKYCRFASIDDNGYTAKIGVYENWEKDPDLKKGSGSIFDKTKIRWYNIFNNDINVIASQIKEAGKIEKFKGQIYFHFLDTNYLYPLSPFDTVSMDCDTEFQVSVFKNNMTRNGMVKKSIIRMVEPESEEDEIELQEEIKRWQGVDGDNTLVLYDEIDPESGELKKSGAFAVDTIDSNIDDKMFDGWQRDLANNIRKAVKALPAILIDYEENKLGTTSGEGIIQATNFYNAMTRDDRESISEMFKEIFSNFDNQTLASNQDWTIKELELYGNTIIQPAASN
jgi:hypothetical protein